LIMSELVFVYGTLRRGASNDFRLAGGRHLGRAVVRGRLYGVDWYPGLIVDPGGGEVVGEVWEVGPESLERLDEFEGIRGRADDEYRRRMVEVVMTADRSRHMVWTWEYRGEARPDRRIRSGDWFRETD